MDISKKVAILFGSLGLIAGTVATVAMQTHAQTPATTSTTAPQSAVGRHNFTPPAAMGAVTAISGNTITLTDKKSGTTFTVDATNATVNKFTPGANGAKGSMATILVSGIAVGDNITVEGTVSGTSITATKINDGAMFAGFRGGRGPMGGPGGMGAMGTVSAVSGNTITLTGKNGTTYTVDASASKFEKVSSASISNISVGDSLSVQGTTSGSNISAKNIVDGLFPQK